MALFTYAPSTRTRHAVINCQSQTIKVVPRIELQWPAALSAVMYFKKYANLVNETPDLENDMNWANVQEWTIFNREQCYLDQLAKKLHENLEDEVRGDAKIVKVEMYDADTHELLAVA